MAYNGQTYLISGLTQKNNGNFPLVDAKDVYVDDNTRLNAKLEELEEAIQSAGSGSSSDSIPNPSVPGIDRQYLKTNSQGNPEWANIMAGEVLVGTNKTLSYELGEINLELDEKLDAPSTTGTEGQVLQINNGNPVWATLDVSDVKVTNNQQLDAKLTSIDSSLNSKLESPSAAGTNGQFLKTGSNGSEWAKIGSSDIDVGDNKSLGTKITEIENSIIPKPSAAGTEGQVLRVSNGGGTEWSSTDTPTQAQVTTAVNAWMTDNPNTRALIEDNMISYAKLDSNLKGHMDGITSTETSNVASATHDIGQYFFYNGVLHEATDFIAIGDTIEVGTNCKTVPNGLGGKIVSLEKAIESLVVENEIAITVWTQGEISVSNGTSLGSSSTHYQTMVKTTKRLILPNYIRISYPDTLKIRLFVYTSTSDETYEGAKSWNDVDLSNLAGKYVRICAAYVSGDNIAPADINDTIKFISKSYTDGTLSQSGKAADAEETGLKFSHVDAKFSDINNCLGIINYNYDTPYNRDQNPSSTTSDILGVKRDSFCVTLDGNSMASDTICIRLTNGVTTTFKNNYVEAWGSGIELMAGHRYCVTMKYISGGSDSVTHPTISVYRVGESSTVGTSFTSQDGTKFVRNFTAEENTQYNIVMRVPSGQTYSDTKYSVILSEAQEENNDNVTGLPGGYQPIEYIETTGYEHILCRPGTAPLNQNSRVIVTFAQTENGVGTVNQLFGARQSASSNGYWFTIYSDGGCRFGYDSQRLVNKFIRDTDIHTVDCNRNKCYIDGECVYTASALEFETPVNGYVGAIRGGNTYYHGKFRIYRYREYVNDILVSDLVPAIQTSTGKIGMYDLVGNRFPTNSSGSGALIAGPYATQVMLSDKETDIRTDITVLQNMQPRDYVKSEADRVSEKVRSVQNGNTLTFIAVSDMHYNCYIGIPSEGADSPSPSALSQAAIRDMGDGIKAIASQTHIDFYASFGDMIYQWQSDHPSYARGVKEMVGVTGILNGAFGNNPQIRIVGNHDPNCENTSDLQFDANMLYTFTGIYNNMLKKDKDHIYGSYGFHDFDDQKIRLIVLNTSFYKPGEDPGDNNTRYFVGPEQATWLINTLMDLSNKQDATQWQIIICSHVALDNSGKSNIYKCTEILDAYQKGEKGSFTLPNKIKVKQNETDPVNVNISYDFRDINRAKLALYFNGHSHCYFFKNMTYRTSSSNATALSMANLYIINAVDGRDVYSIFKQEDGGIEYLKTYNTAESTAFQVITIDPVNKMLYSHHYGAGVDIVMHYEPKVITSETEIEDKTLITNLTSVTWYSKDETIATVNNGVIEPIRTGNTMIFCVPEYDVENNEKPESIEVWNVSITVPAVSTT